MDLWTNNRLREEFLNFFASNDHKIYPSSSLTNSGDPSVILTTAGMQQFKPYYLDPQKAKEDIPQKGAASSQKCFRTTDIDEVGDTTHNTFFEMLGNFSFGGYFKEEAIAFAHEFITQRLGLPISYVTVFQGSGAVPKDVVSAQIWRKRGITDVRQEGMEDVFWGPTGNAGPCGPTTEIYCKNAAGQDVEIWNIVFNEFFCEGSRDQLLQNPESTTLTPLQTKGIDTGMGLERILMIAQNKVSIFDTDVFAPLMHAIATQTSRSDVSEALILKSSRIIADHMRGGTFLMAEGLQPSNVKAGYILRRILRRAIRFAHTLSLPYEVFGHLIKKTARIYESSYPELLVNQKQIQQIFEKEYNVFGKTLKKGITIFEKSITGINSNIFPGSQAFFLFATYGFPLELIEEMLTERGLTLEKEGFDNALEAHRQASKKIIP